MADTLFADISYFQVVVNDEYPYAFLAFRSNDGTYRDPHFAANLAWAKRAVKSGKIKGFLVYFVFESNWQETVATLKSQVGTPHPKMAVMIDVESWNGKLVGNHSDQINATREAVISWLNNSRGGAIKRRLYRSRDRKRVVGYANAGDFASLWPVRKDTQITLANYSSNPSEPKHIIHQFSSTFPVKPFGTCDINSADGLSPDGLVKTLGLDRAIVPQPKPKPPAPAPKFPLGTGQRFGEHGFNGKNDPVHRNQIAAFQRVLVKHGFVGKVDAAKWCDGTYGPETTKAVNAFKASKHWKQNGQVGRPTWRALFKL